MNPRLAILRACKNLITPWARYLLNQGVSYREFDEVVRSVFVDIATKDFGIRGRPTNASRVAVLTGLTRKQIKRIRESMDDAAVEEVASANQATVVLAAWFTEKDFLDNEKKPIVIPFEGGAVSFSELVRRFGRDIPPRAMLRELKRTKAVEELHDGLIRARSRFNVIGGTNPASIERTGYVVGHFISTAVYNLMREPEDPGRFERRSFARGLSQRHREQYEALVKRRGKEFLEELDDWLGNHLASDPRLAEDLTSSDPTLLGAGVYLFSDNPKKRV